MNERNTNDLSDEEIDCMVNDCLHENHGDYKDIILSYLKPEPKTALDLLKGINTEPNRFDTMLDRERNAETLAEAISILEAEKEETTSSKIPPIGMSLCLTCKAIHWSDATHTCNHLKSDWRDAVSPENPVECRVRNYIVQDWSYDMIHTYVASSDYPYESNDCGWKYAELVKM